MKLDFNKGDGLIPVIIQDSINLEVLMLGYMNEEALEKTKNEGRVTFFSRFKNRLWTKGETSGNFLEVVSIKEDCDKDSLLILSKPVGPVCHTGTRTCFNMDQERGFLYDLESIIHDKIDNDVEGSYTNELYKRGINEVAQKVGEEAVEVVIESKDDNEDLFLSEAADLMYHYLILLKTKNFELKDVEAVLSQRNK